MNPYLAAREGVAFRRRRERAVLRVTGKDRLAWLQGLLTNDVTQAVNGTGVYSAWLTPNGRMITDAIVVDTGAETLLDVPAASAGALAARLDGLVFTEDVRIEDASAAFASIGVYGPDVTAALARLSHDLAGPDAIWTRAFATGLTGVHLIVPTLHAAGVEEALAHGGAAPLDDRAALVLRVEAGVPAFHVDMDEDTIPLEAGLDHALSHTKGCYVGQEIIVRIRDRAHGRVARRLVGLRLAGDVLPAAPRALTHDGRNAGRLTSIAASPAMGGVIALATVPREFAEPGESVTIDHAEVATVHALPFVSSS